MIATARKPKTYSPGEFTGDAVEHFAVEGRTAFRRCRWLGFGERFDNRRRRLRVDQHRDVHIGVDGVDGVFQLARRGLGLRGWRGGEEVDLRGLMSHTPLKLGIVAERSYGTQIDDILRQLPESALSRHYGNDATANQFLCHAIAQQRPDPARRVADGIAAMRRLKAAFDPGNILNPGRVIDMAPAGRLAPGVSA